MDPSKRPTRGHARTAILAATLDIIAADGIDAVTHRRVAESAGVSPGSTTHHFSSRENLIKESFRFYLQMASRFMSSVDDEIRPSTSDPLERVFLFVTEIVRRELEAGAQSFRTEFEMLLYASGDSELASLVRSWDTRWVGHIAGDLEAAGWNRPVDTARTVISLVRGFEIERLIDPNVDIQDFQRRLQAVLAD